MRHQNGLPVDCDDFYLRASTRQSYAKRSVAGRDVEHLIDSPEASRSAIASATGTIIGIIDRANSIQTGFSVETMSFSCGPTPPLRGFR